MSRTTRCPPVLLLLAVSDSWFAPFSVSATSSLILYAANRGDQRGLTDPCAHGAIRKGVAVPTTQTCVDTLQLVLRPTTPSLRSRRGRDLPLKECWNWKLLQ